MHPNLNLKLNIMSDIASRVKAIIVDKLGVDENEVVTEASFTNDLGASKSAFGEEPKVASANATLEDSDEESRR